jgi:LytS/YehU family sensor histidine kinase
MIFSVITCLEALYGYSWVWAPLLAILLLFVSTLVMYLAYVRNLHRMKRKNITLEKQKIQAEKQNDWLRAKNKSLEIEHLKAQLEQVRNQLNPHFVFNCLNTIAAVIPTNPTVAIQLIEAFAKLFRKAILLKEEILIPLTEELEHLDKYIFIQKTRFPFSMQIDILVSPEAEVALLPPFSLQILVDNALNYNEISREKPLQIIISSSLHYLEVRNSYQPRSQKEIRLPIDWESLKRRYNILSDRQPYTKMDNGFYTVYLPLINPTIGRQNVFEFKQSDPSAYL